MKKENIWIVIWTIIIMLIFLSILGYFNRDNKVKLNTTWKEASKENSEVIKSISIGLLNDSYNNLTVNDTNMLLSDESKITAAAKYMYITKEFVPKGQLNQNTKNLIVKKANEIFNSNLEFTDFKINFSNYYCGASNYDSKSGKISFIKNETPADCLLPFIIFKLDKVMMKNNNFKLKAFVAFPKEIKSEKPLNCGKQASYSKKISAYSNKNLTKNIFYKDVSECCIGTKCNTLGFYKEAKNISEEAEQNNSYYNIYFKKQNDKIVFKEIKKN